MAQQVEFKLKVKVDGSNEVHNLTVAAEGLDGMVARIGETAARTQSRLRNMAALNMVLDGVSNAFGRLRDMVSGLAAPYESFEKSMRAVNTMAGKDGAGFDALSSQVEELSRNIPLAREELANGLYQTISNGVPEDNWISFLEASSRSAVGGLADLGQTVTVTSTLIKNYGLSWNQAAAVQDKIQMTAKNGVTSFEQLGQALPRVSGSAAQLGVSMDELMAVFATTTGVTGKTAEVSTQLAAVLNALIKPSAEATKAANAMGVGFNAASVQAAGGLENFLLGLDASIQEYAAKTGQLSQTIYGQLFGSAEALRLLNSLTGEQKEKFSENIAAMADSAGTIDEAFGNMASTGESVRQMFRNQIQSMADWAGSIASTSEPYLEMIANTGMAITSIIQLGSGVKTAIAGLKALSVATLAQSAASKAVAAASAVWRAAQTALNFVLSANPIGIVITAIGAMVAAFATAYNNCEEFRDVCDQVWSAVKKVAAAVWDTLVNAFEKASEVIKKAWEWVKRFFGIKDETTARQTADIEKNTKAIEANTGAKDRNAQTAAALAALQGNKKQNAPDTDSDQSDGKTLIANASTYKELGNNIKYYQDRLESADGTDAETIALYARKIALLKQQQDAITRVQEAASRPKELDTLDAIDKEIAYQQGLRERATASELAGIEQEIRRLKDLKTAFERNAHVDVGTDKIATYKQLEDELQYCNDLLKDASETERTEIQRQINALEGLRQKWDDMLAELKKPADISQLNTIGELDQAVSYYQAKQKKADASEIAGIQRTVLELQKKRDALQSLSRIPEMQDETTALGSLGKQELTVELKAIGIDGIRQRIKELQDMLAKNPAGDSQRAEIEGLIESYQGYQDVLARSSVTAGKAWDTLKGLGGGIASMTEALQGNRNAWQLVTGVVDSAIQIYNGISSVIAIVRALTSTTEAGSAATAASRAITATATASKTAAAAEEVVASAPVIAAVKAEAMAYRELAASKFMAAHAAIPFAGEGIAAGFIAAMQGLVASVAVTPFANGGVVYGPTLGIFGEYAGARTNPEVVAPLDKLKALIAGEGGGSGRVEFVIDGRVLRGILDKTDRIRSRTS